MSSALTAALTALVLWASEEPQQGTPTSVRRITATSDDAQPPPVAPSPPPPDSGSSAPLIPNPVFEAGAVFLSNRHASLAGGPTFRVTLRDGNRLMAGSLDLAIALSGGRTLLMGGGGIVREVRRRFEVFALGLGGVDAVNGPPVGLYPVIAARLGGNWNAKHWLLKAAGLTATVAYDVPFVWARGGRADGLSFSLAATAAFELHR